MLRTALCCVLLAATAVVADPWPWIPLDPTPDNCPVGHDARITYGADSIWGVFPDSFSPTHSTWYSSFPISDSDPRNDTWSTPELVPFDYMYHTGLTFQWGLPLEALYLIGDDGRGNTRLMWHPVGTYYWISHNITQFSLGDGACIVYAPNPDYDTLYQVPGFIYCLPGNGTEFWRYPIDATSHTTVQGIFPPDGSIIADQTPLFQWNSAPPGQYRLQVSTDPNFIACVIDVVVYSPQYQTPSELANDTYYWRIGLPNGINWLWGATYSFVLVGGFVRIWNDIPDTVRDGAAMAYEADQWCWEGRQSIIATVGGGGTSFYKYDIGFFTWTQLHDTPKPQYAGTSLTTNDPTGEYGQWPSAAFGGSTIQDRPWSYDVERDTWIVYDTADFDSFPQPLGPGASFVCGLRPYSYLIAGEQGGYPTHDFYAIDPKHIKHPHGGGSQSGDTRAGSTRAQVITSHDGIEVEYQLPAAAHVRATLHDAVGRQVGALDAGVQKPGIQRVCWNEDREGRKLSAGAYFVTLDMGKVQARLKAVVK